MKLGEKLRYLRLVEATLRGLDREMTQQDLAIALKKELGSGLSQSYLSQIESGARPHLTNASRMLLARFFKVHPGYLVDDPEGYHPELMSEVRGLEDKLDVWLVSGAERFRRDPELKSALLAVAQHERTRECLLLLESILETPGLMARLTEVLRKQGIATPTNTNRSLGTPAGTGIREQGSAARDPGTGIREKKKTAKKRSR
jgi:transcriptional regulator with XRE-family HTH domain